MTQERLSVSIPAPLVAWVREFAAVQGVPISHVIAEAIRRSRSDEMSRQMIVGLLEDDGQVVDPTEVDRAVAQIERQRRWAITPHRTPVNAISAGSGPTTRGIR